MELGSDFLMESGMFDQDLMAKRLGHGWDAKLRGTKSPWTTKTRGSLHSIKEGTVSRTEASKATAENFIFFFLALVLGFGKKERLWRKS